MAIQAKSFNTFGGNVEGDETYIVQPVVRQHVEPGSVVHTDNHFSYQGLHRDYTHNVIDHAEKYVDGIEPFHVFRYLDEQVYRFNNRKLTDAGRFVRACMAVFGKRLTYTALTGNELPEMC